MIEKISAMSLETAMDEMEVIAAKMEQNNVSIEETMLLYERGMALAAHCRAKLDGYALRIRILQDGEEKPFEL
jgi:exodeoxyribonuclease VII small subunit